jgi:hypothetical protein
MGVKQYKLGMRHAKNGTQPMSHRNGRRYDSKRAQESYDNGLRAGAKQQYIKKLVEQDE